VPSWFVYGELDRNIPAGAHQIMAERAQARQEVEIPGASHVVGISHASATARTILAAASAEALADA
jgi:pimeloyl-ACP methyl ester carboxylesterase